VDRALTVIGQIYDAILGDGEWSSALVSLSDYSGMASAALVIVDNSLGFASVTAPRADPELVSAYNSEWWKHDPTVKATATTPVGQLTSLANTGRKEFLSSAFHQEFWSRSGLGAERIATNLILSDNAFASCVWHTSPRHDEVDDGDFRRLADFTPHLVRAVAIQRKIQRLTIEKALVVATDPAYAATMIVDGDGCLIFADEAGEGMLASGEGIGVRERRLILSEPNAHARLMRAVVAVCGAYCDLADNGPICLFGGEPHVNLIIDVLPCPSSLCAIDLFGTRRVALVRIRKAIDRPGGTQESRERQEGSSGAEYSSKRVSQLATLKSDIQQNHSNPELSLEWLARRHGMSSRAIRNLFYSENTSFSAWLMRVRLDHARAMLTDLHHHNANIAAIALEAGFGDLSWFHHVFRRRFGMTPAEVRGRLTMEK
jgi:AraC-like DNA-binding protein